MSDGTTGAAEAGDEPMGGEPERRTRAWVVPLVLVLLAAVPIAAVTFALASGGDAEDAADEAEEAGGDGVPNEREMAASICEEMDTEGGIAERDRIDALTSEFSRPSDLRRLVRSECGPAYSDLIASARAEQDLASPTLRPPSELPGVTQESYDLAAPFAFSVFFDSVRDGVAGVIEDSPGVESVDVITYDVVSETIRVVVSPVSSTDDRLVSVAWEIFRSMTLNMFDSDIGVWSDLDVEVQWMPEFHLDVGDLALRCSGDALRSLLDRDLSRAEWESACS